MIKITNNGDYANFPIQIKIPIVLPNGYFAMGFFFNNITGELEGIPIDDLSENFITISTKHFIAENSLTKTGSFWRM